MRSQFITLLKLEFLNNRNRDNRNSGIFSRLFKYLIILIGLSLIGVIVYFALNSILGLCLNIDLEKEFLLFYIFLIQIIQILFGLNLVTKTLYFSNDNDLMKLPVKGLNIFLSKICYLYIKELIFCTCLSLPVFIIYGIMAGEGAFFFCMIPVAILLSSMIPFFIGLVLSVPTMYIMAYLKNKFITMLGLYIIIVAVGFSLYINGLQLVLAMIESGDVSNLFSSELILNIKRIANYLYFPILVRNLLFNHRFLTSLFVGFVLCAIMAVVILYFANKIYLNVLLKNSEGENQNFNKKIKAKERKPFNALLNREFLNIFRSVNYSFQYLTITITTPLMVYFSNAIASNVGIENLGENILPGVSVLVLIMFLTMGTSFAATSITREGGSFFHTKIIPVSFKKQVFVKFMLHAMIAVPAVFISCLVLAFFEFISFVSAILIALSVSLIIIGNICSSINLDIKRPQFLFLNGKEVTKATKNMASTLSQGFLIASLLGAISIVVSFVFGLSTFRLVLFSFSIPYFAIEVFRLFYKIEKKYRRIEA